MGDFYKSLESNVFNETAVFAKMLSFLSLRPPRSIFPSKFTMEAILLFEYIFYELLFVLVVVLLVESPSCWSLTW